MLRKDEVLAKLSEATDLLDRLELLVNRMKPGDQLQPGLIYQIYESLVVLREKILETRIIVLQEPDT